MRRSLDLEPSKNLFHSRSCCSGSGMTGVADYASLLQAQTRQRRTRCQMISCWRIGLRRILQHVLSSQMVKTKPRQSSLKRQQLPPLTRQMSGKRFADSVMSVRARGKLMDFPWRALLPQQPLLQNQCQKLLRQNLVLPTMQVEPSLRPAFRCRKMCPQPTMKPLMCQLFRLACRVHGMYIHAHELLKFPMENVSHACHALAREILLAESRLKL